MPLTNQQLGLDPKAPDNDYQGDDEVLAFAEAAEHLKFLGEIPDDIKPRLTFEITFVSRHLNHDIPNYWAVYLDHQKIAEVDDGSDEDPDGFGWTRIHWEVYSTGDALKTEAEAKALSNPNVHHIAFTDEHSWYSYEEYKDMEYHEGIGDAYWASFATLEQLLNYKENTTHEPSGNPQNLLRG